MRKQSMRLLTAFGLLVMCICVAISCNPRSENSNASISPKGNTAAPLPTTSCTLSDARFLNEAMTALKAGHTTRHRYVNLKVSGDTIYMFGYAVDATEAAAIKTTIDGVISQTGCTKRIDTCQYLEAEPPVGHALRQAPKGGCVSPYRVCGSICIPPGEDCAIR